MSKPESDNVVLQDGSHSSPIGDVMGVRRFISRQRPTCVSTGNSVATYNFLFVQTAEASIHFLS